MKSSLPFTTLFSPTHKNPVRIGLSILAASSALLSQAYGQANITTSGTSGQQTTTFTGVDTVTFDAPAAVSSTGTYSYTGTMLNGNANFSGLGSNTAGDFTTTTTNAPTGDTTQYLAVGKAGATTTASVSFTGTVRYIGLLWGTPNYTNNTLTINYLLNGTAGSMTYTASSVIGTGAAGTATDGGASGRNGVTEYVDFVAQPGYTFTGATISDTGGTTFQLDNLAYGAVPEPATWLGGGLLTALGLWGMRRQLAGLLA